MPAKPPVDREVFEAAIRENLSPQGLVAIVALLQTADCQRPGNDAGRRALREASWLAETLLEMIGAAEYNRLLEEIGL